MINKRTYIEIVCALFILLFIYTAFSKLLDIQQFKKQMYNQPFDKRTIRLLLWALPTTEILVSIGLLVDRTRRLALYLATGLMAIFSGYVLLILLNYFHRVPCSCGGVISSIGWNGHLALNLFFLSNGIIALFFLRKTENSPDIYKHNRNT